MNQSKTDTQLDRISKTSEYAFCSLRRRGRIEEDKTAEQILSNQKDNPLGKLLSRISKMPEVRFEKVHSVRRQICKGRYSIDDKLEAAMDNMLEDMLISL